MLWRVAENDGFYASLRRQKELLRSALEEDLENTDLQERHAALPVSEADALGSGIILRKGGTFDPSGALFKDWRKVMYLGGGEAGVLFGLSLIKAYVEEKSREGDFVGKEITVDIHNTTGLDLSQFSVTAGSVTFKVITQAAKRAHPLDAIPPVGWKVLEIRA